MTTNIATTMATTTTTTTMETSSTTSLSKEQKRTGGIAWAGSLVGSENPNNLGYRYSNPTKRYRRNKNENGEDMDEDEIQLPSNIVVQLQNRQGEELANALDVPTESSIDDLQALVHSLLNDDDDNDNNNNNNQKKIPYSFYAKIPNPKDETILDDVEITTTLKDLICQYQLSTEHTISITYQPLAVFRVKPVTRCTDTMPGHTEAILHVSYSPDGKQLASGGGDTTVRFWDVNTSLPKLTCKEHKNHVLCTAWSPDGTRFASGDKNGVLIVWNPMNVHNNNNNNNKNTTEKSKSSSSSNVVSFCKKAHKQWITSISWEPMHLNQGKCERLVTSSKDCTVKIWNARTQSCLVSLSGHTDSIECVKWGGEGFLYTASRDRTIKVWTTKPQDKALGLLVKTLQGHSHRINTLALSTDYVCRTGPFDHRGKVFNENQLQLNNNYNDDDKKRSLYYQAACEKYRQFQEQQQQQNGESSGGAGTERLVSGSDDFTLIVWNPIGSKHPIKRLTGHQQIVNHIAFSPDGRYVASASFDKKVKLWNGYSGDFLGTLTGHVGAVYQVAWSSDSRFLVSASKDSTAKVWPMQLPLAKKALTTLPGHADEVYALDWSPNGASVATGSKDRTIKIWKH